MSHTQHTPGPWVLAADREHFDTLSIVTTPNVVERWPHRQLLVQVGGAAGVGEQEANARLIAAAPAMLAALRAMVGVTINSGQISDDMAPALEMALAVIKQATGDGE